MLTRLLALLCTFQYGSSIKAQIDLSLLKVNNKFHNLIQVDTVIKPINPIERAEQFAGLAGRKILQMGRKMALIDKTILPGTCWTYVNSVFKMAGFAKNRRTIHRGKKQALT